MVLVGSLSTRYPGMAQWMFGLGACIASIVWFSALGFGARLLQAIFRNPKAWRVLDGCIAIFMLTLCLLLLLNPLH
jgi:L-lysine exporter family protein LysE/ArgO